MKLQGWRLAALMVTLVVASGFVEFRIRQFEDYAYTTYIPAVLNGTYGAPAIYRVLVPYSNTWIADWTGLSAGAVWHASRLFWFSTAYVAFFFYLRCWFDRATAFAGVCAVAATLPLTYTNSWAHADSIPELALFTLGCLAIIRGWDVLFGVVLALAALNRETSGFLVLAYFLGRPPSVAHLARTALFGAIFLGIFGGLRVWRGVQHYDYWQFRRNVGFLGLLPPSYDLYKRFYAWFIVVLLGPAIGVIASGWASIPSNARRLLWSALPFFVVAVMLSSIIETRIFVPLFPLVMPALMLSVGRPISDAEDSADGS